MATFNDLEVYNAGVDPISHGFDDFRQCCEKTVAELKMRYAWTDADFRLFSIHQLRNLSQSVLALHVFRTIIFPSADFWQAFFVRLPRQGHFEDHNQECEVLVRFGALHGLFSLFETHTRKIVAALDPTACGGGAAEFGSVMGWLSSRINQLANARDFLRLLRLTRNTIHNNGVHRPTSKRSGTIIWAGRPYEFIYMQPIKFADLEFVLRMFNDVLARTQEINTDSAVVSLR